MVACFRAMSLFPGCWLVMSWLALAQAGMAQAAAQPGADLRFVIADGGMVRSFGLALDEISIKRGDQRETRQVAAASVADLVAQTAVVRESAPAAAQWQFAICSALPCAEDRSEIDESESKPTANSVSNTMSDKVITSAKPRLRLWWEMDRFMGWGGWRFSGASSPPGGGCGNTYAIHCKDANEIRAALGCMTRKSRRGDGLKEG